MDRYHYPPGLKFNLLFYGLRRFRPLDPIPFFTHLAKQFGEIAHYKLGPEHVVFVNSPEYIREVLVVQHDSFVRERTVRRSKMLLGDGMITTDDPEHKAQRRVAQPAFHRQRIAGYAATIARIAQDHGGRIEAGQEFDIAPRMMELTLDLVAQTLFSSDLGAEVREVNDAVNQVMSRYNYLVALPAAEVLVHLRFPGLGLFSSARRRLDQTIYRIIRARREQQNRPDDLLTMMLEASPAADDESLRDQVITILLAGYETVANALTWTWYLLGQNPESRARLEAEIDSLGDNRELDLDALAQLSYSEMVLAESMRLYPPAWAMGRRSTRDFALGPYRFPAKTTVLISQYVTHRNPALYPDPLRFDPERFTAEAKAARPRLAYFPFGAGPRQCIGEAFAWMEAKLILAEFVRRWRFEVVPGQTVTPNPLITLRPKFGLRVQATRRSRQLRLDRIGAQKDYGRAVQSR